MRVLLAFLIALFAAQAARADLPVVISAAPDSVAVTIYRDPDRSSDNAMELDYLNSFALISETRTVDLPPGPAIIRFEGVAGGIIPQSAILFGSDVREKNRDAALLSQKGLIDGFTGQRVILRRTDPATGKQTQEAVTVRSLSDRLLITTPRGVEAVYCSGLNQTILFPNAPKTLSAKPVLSMQTRDQTGGRVTITLAYLASKFDWEATYVGELSPDARELSLLSWLTMANGDETSFVNAQAAAVAGKINREDDTNDDTGEDAKRDAQHLNLRAQCWPAGTTSSPYYAPIPPPSVSAPMDMVGFADENGEIIVTAMKRMELMQAVPVAVTAVAESLGDLRLYRIPVPVTVAAQSQKQVAFLVKNKIKGRILYRARAYDREPYGLDMLFRFKNAKRDGAGDPLPQGRVALFQTIDGNRMLVGESQISDKAVDEDVDLVFGEAANVSMDTEDIEKGNRDKERWHRITLSNANSHPIEAEIEFFGGRNYNFSKFSGKVRSEPGKKIWALTVGANETETLEYRTQEVEEDEG